MMEFDVKATSFQQAKLRSEATRVRGFLVLLGGLLALILIRAIASVAQGRRGEAWPFAVAVALMAAYETIWLRFIIRSIESGRVISHTTWRLSIFVESLLPTAALLLQIHASGVGPQRALTSPVVLVYVLLILLSTLHLDPALSRFSGGASAVSYGLVSVYAFLRYPEITGSDGLLVYATFSCAALLLLGGFAAAAVAHQIWLHVMAALQEAEGRAKTAQDLEIARSIQQGLLPKAPPRTEEFDIAGWNRPADETGGDYFDWQELEDGHLAVTIADVTGHGIGSALCMAGCRAYARAGFATDIGLRDFLESLNRLLHEDLPSERFVTMAVGLLDFEDSTLELISAGHGPLLFYLSAEDRFRSYDAQGLPLGLLPHARYGDPQTLKFASGDILVLTTDGFVEWANADDEDFGQRRLKEVIRRNCKMPSATIISELYAAVRAFAGTMPQLDDLTVLVVKRN